MILYADLMRGGGRQATPVVLPIHNLLTDIDLQQSTHP